MGKIPIIRIAELREAKKITQAELARAIDADVSTVRNFERNRSGSKMILRVINICNALDCDVRDSIEMVDVEEIEND